MREREKAPGEYSLIKAMYVCAAPKGRVFAPFWSENGYRLSLFWSGRVLVFEGRVVQYCRPESSRIPLLSIGKPEV